MRVLLSVWSVSLATSLSLRKLLSKFSKMTWSFSMSPPQQRWKNRWITGRPCIQLKTTKSVRVTRRQKVRNLHHILWHGVIGYTYLGRLSRIACSIIYNAIVILKPIADVIGVRLLCLGSTCSRLDVRQLVAKTFIFTSSLSYQYLICVIFGDYNVLIVITSLLINYWHNSCYKSNYTNDLFEKCYVLHTDFHPLYHAFKFHFRYSIKRIFIYLFYLSIS